MEEVEEERKLFRLLKINLEYALPYNASLLLFI